MPRNTKLDLPCKLEISSNNGDAGYRSPCFSHAKRALFHLSYTPYIIADQHRLLMECRARLDLPIQNLCLPVGELNPGLLRDRQGY